MNYKDKVQVMYQTNDGRYIAILKDDYRLDGSMVIEGDIDSVIADVLRADRWVTINGSHVLIKDGRIVAGMGGKFKGFPFGARFSDKGKIAKSGKKTVRLYKAQKGEKTGVKVKVPVSEKRAKIQSLVKKYKIQAVGNLMELDKDKWKLKLNKQPNAEEANFIKKNKSQFFEELGAAVSDKAKRRRAIYENKRNSVKGLKKISEVENTWDKYKRAAERSFESEGGIFPTRPNIPTVNELLKKYPRAAALRKMENWSTSKNYGKASIGDKAAKDILDGKNYSKVLAQAEKDWSSYTTEHMWDY